MFCTWLYALIQEINPINFNCTWSWTNLYKTWKLNDIVADRDNMKVDVRGSDGAKSFLSSSVPDLEFDPLTVDIQRSDFEINTYGCDVSPWTDKSCHTLTVHTQR